MATQAASNSAINIKREVTMGTAATGGAGGSRLRIIDSPGLEMTRTNIASEERRASLQAHMGRLGSKRVTGSYNLEINPGGAFDLLLESIHRNTAEALAAHATISSGTQLKRIQTPASGLINTSYTIEQHDIDIDQSELFLGTRLTGLNFAMRPDTMSRAVATFMGLDRDALTTAATPYFTGITPSTEIPLVADDSVITYQGSPVTILTGADINFTIQAAPQPVLGSVVGFDIFMNRLVVSGSIMSLRQNLDALDDFDAETEFEVIFSLSEPGAHPKLTFGIRLPRVKISRIGTEVVGGDAAKVETRELMTGPAVGELTAELFTSTETPVAV